MTCLRLIFFSCLAAVLVLSILPLPGYLRLAALPRLPLKGSVVHLVVFVVLAILGDLAYPDKNILLKIVFLVFFGVFVEAIQYFLPYRSCSIINLSADAAAVLLYFLLLRRLLQRILLRLVRTVGYPC